MDVTIQRDSPDLVQWALDNYGGMVRDITIEGYDREGYDSLFVWLMKECYDSDILKLAYQNYRTRPRFWRELDAGDPSVEDCFHGGFPEFTKMKMLVEWDSEWGNQKKELLEALTDYLDDFHLYVSLWRYPEGFIDFLRYLIPQCELDQIISLSKAVLLSIEGKPQWIYQEVVQLLPEHPDLLPYRLLVAFQFNDRPSIIRLMAQGVSPATLIGHYGDSIIGILTEGSEIPKETFLLLFHRGYELLNDEDNRYLLNYITFEEGSQWWVRILCDYYINGVPLERLAEIDSIVPWFVASSYWLEGATYRAFDEAYYNQTR